MARALRLSEMHTVMFAEKYPLPPKAEQIRDDGNEGNTSSTQNICMSNALSPCKNIFNLIGNRCIVHCLLDGTAVEALFNTVKIIQFHLEVEVKVKLGNPGFLVTQTQQGYC